MSTTRISRDDVGCRRHNEPLAMTLGSRKIFWLYHVAGFALVLATPLWVGQLPSYIAGITFTAFFVGWLVVSLARLHTMGRSGWWIAILLCVGPFGVLLWLWMAVAEPRAKTCAACN